MGFPRLPKEKLLPILVNRTAIFFFLMCLFTAFLYLAGTVQNFIDRTQLSLLSIYSVFGIVLMIASTFGMILNISRLLKTRKKRYLLRASGYVFLMLFAAVTVMMAAAITAMSGKEGI